jgi:hypothetical protein
MSGTVLREGEILFSFRMQRSLRQQLRMAAATHELLIEQLANKLVVDGLARMAEDKPQG